MNYTVVWHPDAQNELARIWLDAPDRTAVTNSTNEIDRELSRDPERAGEEFYGDRILVTPPLAVTYAVHPDDRRVEVLQVWHR